MRDTMRDPMRDPVRHPMRDPMRDPVRDPVRDPWGPTRSYRGPPRDTETEGELPRQAEGDTECSPEIYPTHSMETY